jgi:hypothetical protein
MKISNSTNNGIRLKNEKYEEKIFIFILKLKYKLLMNEKNLINLI